MKKLKKSIRIMVGIGCFFLLIPTAFAQDATGEVDLKDNDQLREEVFAQILNNQELFNDFMNEMMQNQQSMNWMMDQHQMMTRMYSADQMQEMMEKNPDMRKPMMMGWMRMMREDTAVYNQMNHMMEQGHKEPGHMH